MKYPTERDERAYHDEEERIFRAMILVIVIVAVLVAGAIWLVQS